MDSEFKTSDIYFAAYLRVAGVPFLDTVRDNGRVQFVFKDAAGALRDLKRQFFNGQAKVSALEYAQALKLTKTLLHM